MTDFDRRTVLGRALCLTAVGTIAPASVPAAGLSNARAIGPAPVRAPTAPRGLKPILNLSEVMTAAQLQAVQAGASIDDSEAFREALAAAEKVMVPAGRFRVGGLHIPSGRQLCGVGKETILALARGEGERAILRGIDVADIHIEQLALDGGGGTIGVAFTRSHRVAMTGVHAMAIKGHGLVFDGCVDTKLSDIDFRDTGAVGGYAAVALVNWSRPGHRNQISGIRGDRVSGRLVGMFGQADSQVKRVRHTNVHRGEAVYFLSCLRCAMDDISHIGGGAGQANAYNPGNDGCAIDGGSWECSATNGLTMHNSGHGLSINGTKGFDGASRCTVRNWTARFSDEGGVVISDQGIDGSRPSFNTISDCVVENPGERVLESAFSCFGGYDNRFVNCQARDSRPIKRMIAGYAEGSGRNGADRNSWSGSVPAGDVLRARTIGFGRNSTIRLQP